MKKKELMEIALRYVEKGYSVEMLRDDDNLDSATAEEKNDCVGFMLNCREFGTADLRKEISDLTEI